MTIEMTAPVWIVYSYEGDPLPIHYRLHFIDGHTSDWNGTIRHALSTLQSLKIEVKRLRIVME